MASPLFHVNTHRGIIHIGAGMNWYNEVYDIGGWLTLKAIYEADAILLFIYQHKWLYLPAERNCHSSQDKFWPYQSHSESRHGRSTAHYFFGAAATDTLIEATEIKYLAALKYYLTIDIFAEIKPPHFAGTNHSRMAKWPAVVCFISLLCFSIVMICGIYGGAAGDDVSRISCGRQMPYTHVSAD